MLNMAAILKASAESQEFWTINQTKHTFKLHVQDRDTGTHFSSRVVKKKTTFLIPVAFNFLFFLSP